MEHLRPASPTGATLYTPLLVADERISSPAASIPADIDPDRVSGADADDGPRSATLPVTRTHLVVLVLGCFIVFGTYYFYDCPGALQTPLRELLGTPYEEFTYQLNLLYSAYSLPNLVTPVLGGALFDRLGPRFTVVAFGSLICLGAACFWVGVATRSFALLVLGRVLCGLGGESLEVAGTTITSEWFNESGYLALALGINLSISRIAAAVQDSVSPWIANLTRVDNLSWWQAWTTGPAAAALLSVVICFLSLGTGFILIRVDTPSARARAGLRPDSPFPIPNLDDDDELGNENEPLLPVAHPSSANLVASPSASSQLSKDTVDEEDGSTLAPASSDRLSTRRAKSDSSSIRSSQRQNASSAESVVDSNDTAAGGIRSLPPSFWLLCALTVALYGSVSPFIHISSDFLQSKWYPGDVQRAGILMGIPDLVCAFGTPLMGLFVDKAGRPGRFLPLSSLLLVAGHALLFLTSFPPLLALLLLGVGSALFAAIVWACVPLLVPDRLLGTAYGAVTVALNLALAGFPMLVATLRARSDSFDTVGYLFLAIATSSAVFAVALVAWDRVSGRLLDQRVTAPRVAQEEEAWSEPSTAAMSRAPSPDRRPDTALQQHHHPSTAVHRRGMRTVTGDEAADD
ncbi:hypothetical protein H9P43_000961 [Blastocladiella emersonii ATCC 22665]|nr:hypothetical protein H9P43_000961 [Blastocladiella emersonii ATCC 22665]